MGPNLVTVVVLVVSFVGTVISDNSTTLYQACREKCQTCGLGAVGRGRCLGLCPSYTGKENPCQPPRKINELLYVIIIGSSIGLLLCIMFAVGGLLCVRMRHKRKDSLPKQSPKALKNFHKELDKFRPHAYTFLAILNNVRRQVREMHRAGNTDAAVICGRSLSDLAKILMLLNRRDVPIIPPDWPRLASWAERLLERTCVPPPQPPVGQLIQFLQTPSQKANTSLETTQSTPMSTLKPPAYEVSIRNQDSPAFRDFSFKPDWSQQWELSQESVMERPSIQHADAWQSRQEVQQNNLWLDDDFFLISFRPQDEIVTVL